DTSDSVLETTLASNPNPDDPNQIDNNNYKARPILVIGALPDLVVTSVTAPPQAPGGTTPFTVRWTGQNQGNADTPRAGWGDRVYLSDNPNPKAPGARTFYLGQVKHLETLAVNASYNAALTVTLAPNAAGQYIVVIADDAVTPPPGISIPGFSPPPNPL